MSDVQAALTSELLGLAGGSVATYILQQYSEKKKEYLSSKRKTAAVCLCIAGGIVKDAPLVVPILLIESLHH